MATPMLDDRELVKMFRAGSEAAARELFDRYCERLMKLAKRRIGQRMTSRVDPEDVIQSAFRTFFVRVRNDQFTFQGENDLFKLLVRLTVHKTLRQVAFHRAAKRNPELEAGHGSVAHELLQQLAADEPPPEVEITLLDEFERFMAQLPEFDRRVLEMRLAGHSTTEIADQLKSYDRKIRRVIERIEELAHEHADQEKEQED
ncbi:MAG TPA: sigma-70 family RNA polymerase sigma factor [Gemmataceae bacterium]|nr:sigma-70 family RNA polymerase sigma factor [Gemmataceae bacterium]